MSVNYQKPLQRLTPKIWKRDEILTFLDIFESTFHASVSEPFDSESDMWQCVSDKLLAEGGYAASAQHCQSKWNFLYKTYINSKNQQGAFYAKIRQIVDYSLQVNSITEAKSSEEATADTHEQIEDLGHEQETELHEDVETLEESEPIDTLEYNYPKVEKSADGQDEPPEQSFEEAPPEQTFEEERPAKRLKVEPEPTNQGDVQPEQPPECKEQQQHQQNPSADLSLVLQTIVNKIDAIHEEQLSQGRRLEWMERLQLENRQTLLEIKNHLKMNK